MHYILIIDLPSPPHLAGLSQFRPPIARRTDLSHIATELWEIPVLWMAHGFHFLPLGVACTTGLSHNRFT